MDDKRAYLGMVAVGSLDARAVPVGLSGAVDGGAARTKTCRPPCLVENPQSIDDFLT